MKEKQPSSSLIQWSYRGSKDEPLDKVGEYCRLSTSHGQSQSTVSTIADFSFQDQVTKIQKSPFAISFRKETKRVESKTKNKNRTVVFLDGSRALIYILSFDKSLFFITHPSIHSSIHRSTSLARAAAFSRGSAGRLFSSGRRCTTDPCAPLRTPCGTFWPPRDPSCGCKDTDHVGEKRCESAGKENKRKGSYT